MARSWKSIEKVSTKDGPLELLQRAEDDFLITVGGRVLMNSRAQRSEVALGTLSCSHLSGQPGARALVAGLGIGITLRAALDVLPATAEVVVAELNPVVIRWCQGPLADLTGGAVLDPRVTTRTADVADVITEAGQAGARRFDAIVLDLYAGPTRDTHPRDDPFYGSLAIERMQAALTPDGTLGVWGEAPDRAYAERLERAGFAVSQSGARGGGLRHVVYIASRKSPRAAPPRRALASARRPPRG